MVEIADLNVSFVVTYLYSRLNKKWRLHHCFSLELHVRILTADLNLIIDSYEISYEEIATHYSYMYKLRIIFLHIL